MPTVSRIPRKDNSVKFNDDGFYQSSVWTKLRKWHIIEHPLCFYCELQGITRAGNIADHFRPRRIYPELSLDPENLRTSCERCHSLKRLFEKGIATKLQFESKIDQWLKETYGKGIHLH